MSTERKAVIRVNLDEQNPADYAVFVGLENLLDPQGRLSQKQLARRRGEYVASLLRQMFPHGDGHDSHQPPRTPTVSREKKQRPQNSKAAKPAAAPPPVKESPGSVAQPPVSPSTGATPRPSPAPAKAESLPNAKGLSELDTSDLFGGLFNPEKGNG